ncbi:MAG: hypothetical protein D6691_01735 [Candidatus Hydrogenedentota bacterium]|nr:MAG: hypothetical protein D6691_01735 [Candidatus Hydrogenedentota bacterium]
MTPFAPYSVGAALIDLERKGFVDLPSYYKHSEEYGMASKSPRSFLLSESNDECWEELLVVAIKQRLAATEEDGLTVDVLLPSKDQDDDFEQLLGSNVLRRC